MSVLAVTDLRLALADALAPAAGSDINVIPYHADAGSIPALMIRWADPWLETEVGRTGQCTYRARLEVWAITSRAEPAAGTPELEDLVSHVLTRLAADPYPWTPTVGNPGNVPWGGVTYWGCQTVVTTVTTPNEET